MDYKNILQLLLTNQKASYKIIDNFLNNKQISLNDKWKFFEYIVNSNLYRNEYGGSELELTSFPFDNYSLYDNFYMERGQCRSIICILDNIINIINEYKLEIDIDDVKKEIIEKRYTHHINDW